jgi:predicted MFS family arabinose efflux permease
VGGTALFATASLGCALAPNLSVLLASRGVQGLGAAVLMPNSLAILGASFSGEARGRAIGIWASIGAVMSAAGPVLGGWLIDTVGWRAIFLINLPLAAAAIALAWIAVPDAAEDRAPTPLDTRGEALATGALAAFTWGLTVGTGPQGWSVAAAGAVAAGVGLMLAFAAVEARAGDAAMTPPALFASRAFVGLNLMTLLLYGALGGFLTLLPYFLITDGGYSATAAGAALLPFPVVMAIGAPLMGAVAGRLGPRGPLTLGSFAAAAGLLLATRIGADAGYWRSVLPSVLVLAAGMAGAAAPLTSAVLGSVDERHTGLASGLNSAVARAGGLVATALIGLVLASRGARLAAEFRTAAMFGAAAAAAAGICAFLSLGPSGRRGGARSS